MLSWFIWQCAEEVCKDWICTLVVVIESFIDVYRGNVSWSVLRITILWLSFDNSVSFVNSVLSVVLSLLYKLKILMVSCEFLGYQVVCICMKQIYYVLSRVGFSFFQDIPSDVVCDVMTYKNATSQFVNFYLLSIVLHPA